MTPLEKLVRRWQAGWARSRGWNEYTDRDGIIAMTIDQANRKVDYILTDETPDRAERVAGLALSDEHPAGLSWLTVATLDAATTRARLAQHGLEVVRPEWLMTSVLAPVQDPAVQEPAEEPGSVDLGVRAGTSYWLETVSQPGRIDARVTTASPAADEVVASGRMVVLGTDAIADVIITAPDHQRRGLGRAVMAALTAAAIRQGATDGLLVASADGLQLYRALGWSTAADIVIARSR